MVGADCYVGGLVDMGSGHLHPLNLALGEADVASRLGVKLFEQSEVTRIDYGPEVQVHTAQGRVRAKTLVLCCNAYHNDLNRELGGKVLPAGSYIIATEPLGEERARTLLPQNMAVCDQRVALDYYRLSADNRLLFGGACHYSGRDPKDIAAYMQPKMLKVFPELADVRIDYQWGGMIGIGANRLPQVGRLVSQPNVYYAQAYSGHGLNATHLAARLLGEAISGQQSGRFDLFAKVPHITFLAASTCARRCWHWGCCGTGLKNWSRASIFPEGLTPFCPGLLPAQPDIAQLVIRQLQQHPAGVPAMQHQPPTPQTLRRVEDLGLLPDFQLPGQQLQAHIAHATHRCVLPFD